MINIAYKDVYNYINTRVTFITGAIKDRINGDITNEKEIVEELINENYQLLDQYSNDVKIGILDAMSSTVKYFLRKLPIEDSEKKELVDNVELSKVYNGYDLNFIIPSNKIQKSVTITFNIGVNDDGYCLNGNVIHGLNNSRIPFSLSNANEDNVIKLVYRILALIS